MGSDDTIKAESTGDGSSSSITGSVTMVITYGVCAMTVVVVVMMVAVVVMVVFVVVWWGSMYSVITIGSSGVCDVMGGIGVDVSVAAAAAVVIRAVVDVC